MAACLNGTKITVEMYKRSGLAEEFQEVSRMPKRPYNRTFMQHTCPYDDNEDDDNDAAAADHDDDD